LSGGYQNASFAMQRLFLVGLRRARLSSHLKRGSPGSSRRAGGHRAIKIQWSKSTHFISGYSYKTLEPV